MDFSDLVRREREKQYKTPTDFHRKAELPCSVVAYMGIEKGTSLPKIDLALEIVRKLGMSERLALLAWARSQMPDVSAKSVFTEAAEAPGADFGDFARGRGALLSNAQVKLISGEPLYTEILLYLSSRLDIGGANAREIAKTLSVDARRMTNLLSFLLDYGLVEKDADEIYRVTGHLNLPDTAEARPIKDALFATAAKKFLASDAKDVVRSTVTRRLSREQMADVRARAASLLASIDALPEPAADDDVYTIGVFASEHEWGTT